MIKTNREQVAIRTLFVDIHIGLKLFINHVLYIFIVCVRSDEERMLEYVIRKLGRGRK